MRVSDEIENWAKDLNVGKVIEQDGNDWSFWIGRLATPRGVCTKLHRVTGDSPDIWIDWSDIVNKPGEARINLFSTRYFDPNIRESLPVAFQRTQIALQGFRLYDTLMSPEVKDQSEAGMEAILRKGNLPRPEVAFVDGDHPLLELFFQTEFSRRINGSYPGAYHIPWPRLVSMASEETFPLVYWSRRR